VTSVNVIGWRTFICMILIAAVDAEHVKVFANADAGEKWF
jgi:hypothetical protein